jgi:hypothetical protein
MPLYSHSKTSDMIRLVEIILNFLCYHLLVFSELPSLPSAGSRPGCFHTSLG